MATFTTLLTHPGSAHKDEFLACSVMLALHPVPVVRKEPSATELADPAIAVIDVGHHHEPALGNFDHHQFPADHAPVCSVSLVLQHLGLYEDARQFCDWLEPAEWFDCRGPIETAKWLGVDRSVVFRLHSPIDGTLLRRFASATIIRPGEPLWEVMRMIGEDLLGYLRSLRERLDFIGRHAEIWTIASPNGPAKIVYLPRTDPLPDDPSSGIERYIEQRGLSQEILGIISPDRRSTGFGLSRYRDNARLDFTRISTQADVHFAHARGFVAKTSANTPERLRELLALAVVG